MGDLEGLCQNSLEMWPFLPQTKQVGRGFFFSSLVVFEAFVRLMMALTSTHTI